MRHFRAEASAIDSPLELLRQAAERSTKPTEEKLKIINAATTAINEPAPEREPEPTTPDARARAIQQIVAKVKAPKYLADFYIKSQLPVATVKSQLLPYLA